MELLQKIKINWRQFLLRKKRFPDYLQLDEMDCGATCLRIISRYYGKITDQSLIRELSHTRKEGVSFFDIQVASEKLGFTSFGATLTIEELNDLNCPIILHWDQNHFVVLYKIEKGFYHISDPAMGLLKYNRSDFQQYWVTNKADKKGFALILKPSASFYSLGSKSYKKKITWRKITRYFFLYKKYLFQLFGGLIIALILQLSIPLLTQYVVDIGIESKDISFVNLILGAQLVLWVSQISVSSLNAWILLHVSARVNISLLTDLLIKIMSMPLKFFEIKTHGDLIQRITDQERIESFLTGNTINAFFSLLSMLLFGGLLAMYNIMIFIVFCVGTILYLSWIFIFLSARRRLDNQRFRISSENQNKLVELIQGIKDIKNNNAERKKRWGWEELQSRLFGYKVKSLSLSQTQHVGSMGISQFRGILITYFSARYVIDGEITLGAMIAIQYIVGAISSPVESLLGFIQSYQDAKISLERLNEVFAENEECNPEEIYIKKIPADKTIVFNNVNFRYLDSEADPIFNNLDLVIPGGKTTAIVGESGSGKTSILKLLMKYYDPDDGDILIGGINLKKIDFKAWRDACGTVMQDNFIFDDTIEGNIALSEDDNDPVRVNKALDFVNLTDFVNGLPLGEKTLIGKVGNGLSQGQRQRIMIARALYKMPEYLFLDEATSALDANNERIISENLADFLKNRTAVIVAHRLSTVKNADNIIVLDKGKIVEQGSHKDLVKLRGKYFELIKNQLEIGG